MRRQVKRVAVCVAVGVAVNVLVAWGCDVGAQIARIKASGLPVSIAMPLPGANDSGHVVVPLVFRRPPDPSLAFGWPVGVMARDELNLIDSPVLRVMRSIQAVPTGIDVKRAWRDGVAVTLPDRMGWTGTPTFSLRFPVRPNGGAFLVGVLFYGFACWVLFVGPGVARGLHRRHRGMCVGCGYDRRGLAAGGVCPECGVGEVEKRERQKV